jgi:hypothetical protein
LDHKGEALPPTSRVNLSIFHTVEHNSPVSVIGKISSRDVERLRHYCDAGQGSFIGGDKGRGGLPDVEEDEDEDDDTYPLPVSTTAPAPVPNAEQQQKPQSELDPQHMAMDASMDNKGFKQPVIDVSSGKRLESSERDSGYASASHPMTLIASSEPAFRDRSVDCPPGDKPLETKYQYDNEIQSLPSDNDDINSQVSNETTYEGMAGKALIRVFLAEEPRFRSLCEKFMAHMDRKRFIENMRRLLKSFHKSLSSEAESEAEKAIARLLRSRRGRLRISRELANHIQQESEEGSEVNRVDLQIAPGYRNLVEMWLARASVGPVDLEEETVAPECEFEGQNIESRTSTSGSDDDSWEDMFPYIAQLENFLRETRSFQILLRDFRLMILPIELRQVLLSIPNQHIRVSREQDLSATNRLKAWVEENTQVKWNWWPLEPRKRMLQGDESRMFWQCVSAKLLTSRYNA